MTRLQSAARRALPPRISPLIGGVLLAAALCGCGTPSAVDAPPSPGARTRDTTDSQTTTTLYRQAVTHHESRRLNDASRGYAAVLKAEPPAELDAPAWDLALRLAPQLLGVQGDPFPLEDVVVLHHPTRPFLAYHLFWDDDIDFPEDNDPTDHEIVWVRYDPSTRHATAVATYFHGRILEVPLPPGTTRPRIGVEWGKHGGVPLGDDGVPRVLPPVLEAHWRTLSTRGTRMPDHPLARRWPKRFDGDWAAYRRFELEIDPRPFLERNRLGWRSRWANAVLDQYALPYNFAPKTDWPAGWGP